jgi:sugar phosphate isomerase/epimerase
MSILAASTLPYLNRPLESALEQINGLGFKGVEIYFEGLHNMAAEDVADALSTYDFKVYFHAPFSDLNLASFNETVLAESKFRIKSALKTAADVGAGLATVHFGRYSPLGLSYPEKAVENNLASIVEINSFAKSLGIQVAFENAPRGFGAMCGSLDVLNELVETAGIKITLDLGHANTWENSLSEFILGLNSAIVHTHIHDNSGGSDNHLGLGEGSIDYTAALRALQEINYKKALCLELLYEEDLKSSVDWIRPQVW